MEDVLNHFKDLVSTPSHSLLPAIIPPPTPEHYKKQITYFDPEQNQTYQCMKKGEKTAENPVQEKVNLREMCQTPFREPAIAHPTLGSASQIIKRNPLFSDRCINPSPVATVYPQLQLGKQTTNITSKQLMFQNNKKMKQLGVIDKPVNSNNDGPREWKSKLAQIKESEIVKNKVMFNKPKIESTHIHSIKSKHKNANKSKKRNTKSSSKSRQKKKSIQKPMYSQVDAIGNGNLYDKETKLSIRSDRAKKRSKLESNNKDTHESPNHRYYLRYRTDNMSKPVFTTTDQPINKEKLHILRQNSPSEIFCSFLSESVPVSKRTRLEMTSYTYSTASFHTKAIESNKSGVDKNELLKYKNPLLSDGFSIKKTFHKNESSVQEQLKANQNVETRRLSDFVDNHPYALAITTDPTE